MNSQLGSVCALLYVSRVSTGLGVAFCLNVNSQLGFAETDDRLVDPSRSCTTLCRLEASP